MLTESITIKSFSPIINQECTTLILGTMPGEESLIQNQYYAHPNNVFWDIMIRILLPGYSEEQIDTLTYEDKQQMLLSNNIALWDVLKHCDRKGSLDSRIRNEIKNDFEEFFINNLKIKRVFFNGQKAEKFFKSCFKHLIDKDRVTKIVLPSTSPSHSLNTFTKLKEWRTALKI